MAKGKKSSKPQPQPSRPDLHHLNPRYKDRDVREEFYKKHTIETKDSLWKVHRPYRGKGSWWVHTTIHMHCDMGYATANKKTRPKKAGLAAENRNLRRRPEVIGIAYFNGKPRPVYQFNHCYNCEKNAKMSCVRFKGCGLKYTWAKEVNGNYTSVDLVDESSELYATSVVSITWSIPPEQEIQESTPENTEDLGRDEMDTDHDFPDTDTEMGSLL